MENKDTVYHTIEIIMEKMESDGDYELQDLSALEEKAVTLLLHYHAVIRATHTSPNFIFPGEYFNEMMEIGPEEYIQLTEKLSTAMIPHTWKILKSNLLISGAVGAAIGGSFAGAIAYFLGCW